MKRDGSVKKAEMCAWRLRVHGMCASVPGVNPLDVSVSRDRLVQAKESCCVCRRGAVVVWGPAPLLTCGCRWTDMRSSSFGVLHDVSCRGDCADTLAGVIGSLWWRPCACCVVMSMVHSTCRL